MATRDASRAANAGADRAQKAGRRPRPRGHEAAGGAGGPAGTAAEPGRDAEPRPAGQGCRARGEPGGPQEPRQQRKTFLYCEPHKRIREVLEEELYIKRDECHIKSPPTVAEASKSSSEEGTSAEGDILLPASSVVALDGIWSIKRNLPVGGSDPGQLSRNSLLPQAKYYSRHGGLRR